jgi:hypothetical protein
MGLFSLHAPELTLQNKTIYLYLVCLSIYLLSIYLSPIYQSPAYLFYQFFFSRELRLIYPVTYDRIPNCSWDMDKFRLTE